MESSSFNNIAKDYHSKRKKPWRPLEFFIKFLKTKGHHFHGIILDLGCANGRNFKIMSNPPNKLIGVDVSFNLLKIAKSTLSDINHFSPNEKNFFQLIHADIVYLPIRENSVNTIFSIATIHHLKKRSKRKSALVRMHGSLKENGNLILTVWRKWQKEFRTYFIWEWLKRNFSFDYKNQQKVIGCEEYGDKYVSWKLSKENEVYDRFYHFFSKHELKKLMKIFRIVEFKITGGPTNRDNFFVFAQKN
ncbi:MAG: class I SAM-dependent methyltransferase [Promethearchaeota archaeon]